MPDAAPPEQIAAGEGTIRRRVTFHVDSIIWRRTGAPELPATFSAISGGWTVHEHRRTPFVARGAAWIETGAQYLMPIGFDRGVFSPFLPLALFPVRDGVVTLAEGQQTPLAQKLSGASLSAAGAVFAAARPDEIAAKYMHLRPSERVEAVAAERHRGE